MDSKKQETTVVTIFNEIFGSSCLHSSCESSIIKFGLVFEYTSYFFVGLEDLLGFKAGLFLGVSLLSRRRLSTSPVDSAIGFGPGLSGI